MVVSFSLAVLQSAKTNAKALKLIQHVLSLVNIGRHKLFIPGNQVTAYQDIMDKIDIFEEIIKKYADFSDKAKPDFFVVIDKTGNIMSFENTYNVSEGDRFRRYTKANKVWLKTSNGSWTFECEFIDVKSYYSYVCDNLKVMLEDKVSDGAMLTAILKAYTGHYLPEDFDIDALDIEGCAGCVSRNMSAITRNNRVFSFVDSDKKHKKLRPSDGKDREHRKLSSIAGEFGYRIMFLKKREIENYIPDRLLMECAPGHIYHKFNDEQKAFFDLKYGLKVRDFVHQQVLDLYSNVLTDKDKEIIKEYRSRVAKDRNLELNDRHADKVLIDGFGKDVYQLFYRHISKEEFDKVDCYGEFKEIIMWIKRYA